MPPRLAMTVGMAVATTVDSMAARNTEPITPASTSPRRGSDEARINDRPCSPRTYRDCAGWGMDRGSRDRRFLGGGDGRVGRRARGIIEPQARERVDARVVVGPRHAEGVAAYQVHVLRLVRARLPENGKVDLDGHDQAAAG